MWNQQVSTALMSSALAVVVSTQIGAAGAAADVTIDFLSDGRCAVSAKGDGFRSSATYTPDGARTEGDRRCAMPPVPPGRTVSLTVSMPSGAAKPSTSTPILRWTDNGDAWVGTASLTEWPDAVIVSPPSSSRRLLLSLLGAGLLLVAAAFGRHRRRTVSHQAA
jgi:hypothetical protein